MLYYLQETHYKSPLNLVVDAIFPIMIFVMFATSYSLAYFFSTLVAYCWFTLLYPHLRRREMGQEWRDYYPGCFRLLRAVIITACLIFIYFNTFDAIWFLIVATALLFRSLYFIGRKLQERLQDELKKS
jgi:amino acid transporter